jgi:hypothetical protein
MLLLSSEIPTCVTPVPVRLICCGERDLAFPFKLAADLVTELTLIGLDVQHEIGALL